MKILNSVEQALFDRPPLLSSAERKRAFDLPSTVWSLADGIRSAPTRIGFCVSAGYFKSVRRFFPASDFHDRDVAHVAARLELDASDFNHTAYIARTRQRHHIQILELAGFQPFDGGAALWLDKELEVMARSQLRPKLIFWRAVDLLMLKRIEIPTSFRLTEMVLCALLLAPTRIRA